MGQFLSYKNYSWDTYTGFPYLWGEKKGEFRRVWKRSSPKKNSTGLRE
jgi:hypothetical protein